MSRTINIGDVVEVQYPETHQYATVWNGFRFQVTKGGDNIWGRVIKTVPTQAKILPVGAEFIWGEVPEEVVLVIVNSKNEQPAKNEHPTSNQVYIDHIYERLVKNVTPGELISLAERLDRAGNQNEEN